MQALSGLEHRTLPVLVFLGFSLRLACGTAFTSVRVSMCVCVCVSAQVTLESMPGKHTL